MAGKSKSTGFQGKLGYVFFTICVGLVCFYIGRVEFLADKLQAADRYTKMRGSSDQPGPNTQRPLQPPGKQAQTPVVQPPPPPQPLNQAGLPVNPFANQEAGIVNQREQAIDLWKQAETMVKSGQDVPQAEDNSAMSAAALVMEKVEAYAKQGVEAIESGAEKVVENVVETVQEVEKEIESVIGDQSLATVEDPLPQPKDIPSRDIANLITNINQVNLDDIFADQVKNCDKAIKQSGDEGLKPSLFFPYDDNSWDWQSLNFNRAIPNTGFVFHNKLPKSGSSTMNNLLRLLSQKNGFKFVKVEPAQIPNDRFDLEKPLVKFVEETKTEPFFLLKHHFNFNFTRHGLRQPTYVNVVRDPTDWFVSQYYFRRYGWARDEKARQTFQGSEEDKERTVDECIKLKKPECVNPTYKYIQYICGNHPGCKTNDVTDAMKEKATVMAKSQAMRSFFAIGVLEQFEDTLKMFETILPNFYFGVSQIWKSDSLQTKRNMTKTSNRRDLSNDGRKFMMMGPLKWESDLYFFIRAMFNEKLRKLNIEPVEYNVT